MRSDLKELIGTLFTIQVYSWLESRMGELWESQEDGIVTTEGARARRGVDIRDVRRESVRT